MKKFIAVMVLSAMGTAAAMAGDHDGGWNLPSFGDHDRGGDHFMAPEIDPASAISGLTLLLGGLTVLRGRIAKK
jgi:hypothetical protein